MIDFLFLMLLFAAGFFFGMRLRTMQYEAQDWQCFKWNTDVLGYRPVVAGMKLRRGDKVMWSLAVDPENIPEEGIVFESEDK